MLLGVVYTLYTTNVKHIQTSLFTRVEKGTTGKQGGVIEKHLSLGHSPLYLLPICFWYVWTKSR